MKQIVKGLKFRHMDNLCCELEMDDEVETYEVEHIDDNDYTVIIYRKDE